jgi:hypothetical protein
MVVKKLASWGAILAVPAAIGQHLRDEFQIHAGTGVVIRLSRRVIVDAGNLYHSLLSIPKDRLAVTSLSGRT